MRLRAASVCSAVSLVGVLAACGSERDVSPGRGSDLTVEQARAFDDFPLYFAGERVDGLPLVAILRRDDTASYVSFVYGDCVPAELDQGCAPPAEIQVWPRVRRAPELYEPPAPASAAAERATVRGTEAAFFAGRTRLELFAGRSTVVIFGDSSRRVLAIADALECVRDRGRGPPGRLPDCSQ
jgi:hypothetical protein